MSVPLIQQPTGLNPELVVVVVHLHNLDNTDHPPRICSASLAHCLPEPLVVPHLQGDDP